MNLKRFTKLSGFLIVLILIFAVALPAAQERDPFGVHGKKFLIQSAMEYKKKGQKAFWDLPGKNKWKRRDKIQAWQMDKYPVGKDRYFTFRVSNTPGKYFISFPYKNHQMVSSLSNGKIVSNMGSGSLVRLKYNGNSRFQIIDDRTNKLYSLRGRQTKNGTEIVLGNDRNGAWTEWVFWTTSGRNMRSFVPKIKKNTVVRKPTMTLDQAINIKGYSKGGYFKLVSADQFATDNSEGKLQEGYTSIRSASEQWTHIMDTINVVIDNQDVLAKRAILKALSEVNVRKGGNFAERMMQNKFGQTISQKAAREKDALCKQYIQQIGDNVKRAK